MRGVPGAQRLRRGADLPRGGAHPGRRVVDEVQAGLLRPRLPLGVAAAVRRHGGGLPGRRRPGPRRRHPQPHGGPLRGGEAQRGLAVHRLQRHALWQPAQHGLAGLGRDGSQLVPPPPGARDGQLRRGPRDRLPLRQLRRRPPRLQLLRLRPLRSPRPRHRSREGAGGADEAPLRAARHRGHHGPRRRGALPVGRGPLRGPPRRAVGHCLPGVVGGAAGGGAHGRRWPLPRRLLPLEDRQWPLHPAHGAAAGDPPARSGR
mmetsp:Transcript_18553/g.55713  ORF Transcript_18553/g.55713 Transcript_18553/m.55713 type:complete len:260 (+) Transcript_18553:1015-1794(+)